jgi:hypothetical protein
LGRLFLEILNVVIAKKGVFHTRRMISFVMNAHLVSIVREEETLQLRIVSGHLEITISFLQIFFSALCSHPVEIKKVQSMKNTNAHLPILETFVMNVIRDTLHLLSKLVIVLTALKNLTNM